MFMTWNNLFCERSENM